MLGYVCLTMQTVLGRLFIFSSYISETWYGRTWGSISVPSPAITLVGFRDSKGPQWRRPKRFARIEGLSERSYFREISLLVLPGQLFPFQLHQLLSPPHLHRNHKPPTQCIMESLQQKRLTTRRSLNYTYFVSGADQATPQCPALLFVHGFPDSAHLWADVVALLVGLPNKIIVPDCLGYAGTDKPSDTHLYTYKGQADDLMDILSHEKVESTIIIGHDWGSALAQRTYLFNRDKFAGMVLLNTGYMVPSEGTFDLDAVNTITTETLGYPQFSYWGFFTAPDAAEIVDANLERMWLALHGEEALLCTRCYAQIPSW